MREIRQSGSEGGGDLRVSPYPYRSSNGRTLTTHRVAATGRVVRSELRHGSAFRIPHSAFRNPKSSPTSPSR